MKEPYPEWLKAQKKRDFRARHVKRGFMGKFAIVKRFAEERAVLGQRITHADIRKMLDFLNRGYTSDAQAISRLLHGVHGGRSFEKYPNGHRVLVTDEQGSRTYKSLNLAAKMEGCSPQSALNWASKGAINRKGQRWKFADHRSRRSKRVKP